MRPARVLRSVASGIALVVLLPDVSAATPGVATPSVEIRLAGTKDWGERAAAEQQGALAVTFFVRIANQGDEAGSFVVDGDHGGAVFRVRYLEGGAGDERITGRVVDGTYTLEDVPPGASRVLRLRVTVADDPPIDRTGDWTVAVAAVDEPGAADAVGAEVRTVTPAFARAAGVTLRVPAERADVTFHQSLFEQAAALRPLGTLVRNANPAFEPPPDGPGPRYLVMASRGRGTPPTSASDDVVGRREPILAPVTGTVIRVTAYRLYCAWDDVRVAIRPDDAPERTVQVFHLVHPRVRRGDHVLVSHTVLGRARRFPFPSQTESYGLGGRHVHLEVERDGSAPLPGCGAEEVRASRRLGL